MLRNGFDLLLFERPPLKPVANDQGTFVASCISDSCFL